MKSLEEIAREIVFRNCSHNSLTSDQLCSCGEDILKALQEVRANSLNDAATFLERLGVWPWDDGDYVLSTSGKIDHISICLSKREAEMALKAIKELAEAIRRMSQAERGA